MRVLLSGTSNSVLVKGINYTLAQDPSVTSFTNCSYGASGTVALGDHLRKIDFTQHDFCVLDYCVNEEVFIWQGDSSAASAMNNLSAMIDAASKAGCQPIVMIFPTSTRANHKRPFEEAITKQLLSRGVPVFNFYAFAHRIMAQSSFTFDDLFLDPMHVRREVGRFMGKAALKYMQSVSEVGSPEIMTSDLTYQPLGFLPFEVVELSSARQIVRRKSKLAAADLLRIDPGNNLRLTTAKAISRTADVIGLTCNAARTIGSLRDAATDSPLIQIKPSSLFAEKRGLTLVTLPITNPLRMQDCDAIINYDFVGKTTELQPDPALELSGLILRSADSTLPLHIARHAKFPTSLEAMVSDAELLELAQLLRSTPAA